MILTNKEHVCSVSSCRLKAEYNSPKYWCKRHWIMWFNWPEHKAEPKWMKLNLSEDTNA